MERIMKRSIVLAAMLALAGPPVSACAAAHSAPTAAAHPAPARAAAALTAGALGVRGLSSPAAKMAAPAWLAICGMRSNSAWPLSAVAFGSVNSGNISSVRLAQCYFSG
jgi:hypothetical protein